MPSVAETIRETQTALEGAGIPDARLEAEVLLVHILAMPRHRIYAQQEDEVEAQQCETLARLIERRLKREPLAYILGRREFYGIEVAVGPGVLVPRPETELLVEQSLFRSLVFIESGEMVIAEAGTGSGALAISLAIHLPMARIYAVELYPDAVRAAKFNIEKHNVADRVNLLQGDLLEPVPEPVDLVVANLPYLREDSFAGLQPEVLWEPREALDGGPDGLAVISRLLREAPAKLKPGGAIMLEIDPDQAEPLRDLAEEVFPGANVSVEQDLAHLDRILTIELSDGES